MARENKPLVCNGQYDQHDLSQRINGRGQLVYDCKRCTHTTDNSPSEIRQAARTERANRREERRERRRNGK